MTMPQPNSPLSLVICAHKQAVPDQGEDSYAYSFDDGRAVMGVFDGCGGAGLRRYPGHENRTGAYIASRLVAAQMLDWYDMDQPSASSDARLQASARALQSRLESVLRATKQVLESGGGLSIGGKMVKTLPTTLSLALLHDAGDARVKCGFIWAGDSRGYLVTPGGMRQCTADDAIGNPDALQTLHQDAPMTNMVNADVPFTLHASGLILDAPCMVMVATDGVFSYFRSPMDVEHFLLDTMARAASPNDWEHRLVGGLSEVAGDDFSLVLAAFGAGTFAQLKRQYQKRLAQLTKEYIAPMDRQHDGELVARLWQGYKRGYYLDSRPDTSTANGSETP